MTSAWVLMHFLSILAATQAEEKAAAGIEKDKVAQFWVPPHQVNKVSALNRVSPDSSVCQVVGRLANYCRENELTRQTAGRSPTV